VTIMLSAYGIIAAIAGEIAIGALGAPLESVKNWLYFIAGLFAYIFALGELGLLRFRMPTYTGAAPAFIQRRQDYLKAFFLGIFLGNIGVGCPHPATPLILVEIARAGDVLYGWSLFFIHAVGRVLPLFLLAILGVLGVNGLSWLVKRKDKVERATGWGMVFVAGFILVLGLFTHDWWVASGQHTIFEELTQEQTVTTLFAEQIGQGKAHAHVSQEIVIIAKRDTERIANIVFNRISLHYSLKEIMKRASEAPSIGMSRKVTRSIPTNVKIAAISIADTAAAILRLHFPKNQAKNKAARINSLTPCNCKYVSTEIPALVNN